MMGIRIISKRETKNLKNGKKKYKIDYEFSEIIEAIIDEINDLYWIFEDTIFLHKAQNGDVFYDWINAYEKIIVQGIPESSHFVRLAIPGFIPKYSKFIMSDTNEIYGFKKKINLWQVYNNQTIKINRDFIIEEVEVYFSCIDGSYWEIYSKRKNILKKIKDNFPASEKCDYSQKIY